MYSLARIYEPRQGHALETTLKTESMGYDHQWDNNYGLGRWENQ